jgi:uncharacterized membrane protein YdjX (TVP38/TMEM64 family)
MTSTTLRLVGVVAFLAALVVIARATGASEQVTVENLRGWVADAGAWGILLFVLVFMGGELIHVPGVVFVVAAVLSYGLLAGGVLSYLAAVLSVCFSFGMVRFMGGKALAKIERPWVRKVMEKLDDHPISTVVILRVTLVMFPPLNYALALSSIKFRDYLIGSVLGLIPPILVFAMFFDQLTQWMGV